MTDAARAHSRFGAWLRLVRVGTLFSPAADVIAGACLAGLPWSTDLVRAAVASVCVYAAGMVLNDHADREEDARQRPERPIPSGTVRPGAALALGVALIVAAVAVTPWWVWHGGLAAGVLAYDYVLKRRPGLAALTMGVLRGANLLAGAAAVTATLPQAPLMLGVALAYAIYIAAVTVLGTFEDEPMVRPRAVVGVQSIPPLVTVLVVLALPERWPALAFCLVLAGAFVVRVRRQGAAWDRAAIRRSMMWLLLGTMVFTSLVCLGSGRPIEAAGIVAAIPVARGIARRIALT